MIFLAWVQGATTVLVLLLGAGVVFLWARGASGPAVEQELVPVLNDVPGGGIMQQEEPNDVTWRGRPGFRV